MALTIPLGEGQPESYGQESVIAELGDRKNHSHGRSSDGVRPCDDWLDRFLDWHRSRD